MFKGVKAQKFNVMKFMSRSTQGSDRFISYTSVIFKSLNECSFESEMAMIIQALNNKRWISKYVITKVEIG